MFGFYDIRGVWGRDLDPSVAERIGRVLRYLVGEKEVAVGRDVRVSSLPLSFHLEVGLGGTIYDIGITTTPMAFYHAWKEGMETFQVTASHNPPEYNGIKFIHASGFDWEPGEVQMIRTSPEAASAETRVVLSRDSVKDYLDFFLSWEVPRASLFFDPSNGPAYQLVPMLREKFDLKVLNALPDGRFPGHSPNPLDRESQRDLIRFSREWGILTDGDGDRLVVAYRGRVLGADEVVAFLADRGAFRSVALEVTMPLALEDYLNDVGVRVERTPTGRVLIKQMAKEKKFDFFAEYSGHFGFREFNYIDDPLYTFFKVLEMGGREFLTDYKPPLTSGVVTVELRREQVARVLPLLDPIEVRTLDGFDVRTELGRIVLRESKTEPGKWRITWEARDREDFEKLNRKMGVVLREASKDSDKL